MFPFVDEVAVDVELIEATTAWVQIHDSRLSALVDDILDTSGSRLVLRTHIEGRMIDAASIYAGVAAVYDYARRRRGQLPNSISWEEVRKALNNMRFFDDEYPSLHAIITSRESNSAGPFERLNAEPI